jgi:2-acylglycerol O-acyltransferase 2/2-acylglycerol O-acyltransferase 1
MPNDTLNQKNTYQARFPSYKPNGRSYCPLKIPYHQRLGTLSALIHCSSIILLPCLYFYLWTIEKFWPFLFIYTIYSYILDNTQSTGESIYRSSEWLRSAFIFEGFVEYFPILTHRSVPLPPTIKKRFVTEVSFPNWTKGIPSILRSILKTFGIISKKVRNNENEEVVGPRYMFVCHPHGVISFGITGSMCWGGENEVTDTIIEDGKILHSDSKQKINLSSLNSHTLKSSKSFKSLFPGITCHLLTLPTQFMIPFYRDYILALGVGLVTKCGIMSILKRNHSVSIVVGGAHESLYAKPGMNRIVLDRRKGFIKIALQNCNKAEQDLLLSEEEINAAIKSGSWSDSMSNMAIVPVYIYGENNIYNVYNTIEEVTNVNENNDKTTFFKTLLNFQLLLKKYTGFTIPLINSRSMLNYDFGVLPYKRRIDVVCGEPIYIYRKFGASVSDAVTNKEIDYYHNLYKEKLLILWRKNKAFATEWDEDLQIVE